MMTRNALQLGWLATALIVTESLAAQEIRQVPTRFEDFQSILEAAGYTAYTFDLSAFEGQTWWISLVCRTYDHGELKGEVMLGAFSSRRTREDFGSEEQWQKIVHEGKAEDPEHGVYRTSRKLTISTLPSRTDSIGRIHVSVQDAMRLNRNLDLHPIHFAEDPKPVYFYHALPFKTSVLKETKEDFIPLYLYGSGWLDERNNIIRFCGEKEIDPELSSEILKYLPHYYILGLKYEKK